MNKKISIGIICLLVFIGILGLRVWTLPNFIAEQYALKGRKGRYFSRSFHFGKPLSIEQVNEGIVYSGLFSFNSRLNQDESRDIIATLLNVSNYEEQFDSSVLNSFDAEKTIIFQDESRSDIGYVLLRGNQEITLITEGKIGVVKLSSVAYQKIIEKTR